MIHPAISYGAEAEVKINGWIGKSSEETADSSSIPDVSVENTKGAEAKDDTIFLKRYPSTGEERNALVSLGAMLIGVYCIGFYLKRKHSEN